MAIVFNKVARKSPKDKSVKYYITPKTIKLMGLRDIAKLVAENTTMSPQEVELVLNSFVNKLQETLLNSYSVRLGDWASFHVTCSSKGASTAKDCRRRSPSTSRSTSRRTRSARTATRADGVAFSISFPTIWDAFSPSVASTRTAKD